MAYHVLHCILISQIRFDRQARAAGGGHPLSHGLQFVPRRQLAAWCVGIVMTTVHHRDRGAATRAFARDRLTHTSLAATARDDRDLSFKLHPSLPHISSPRTPP